jgi:hypothetical protein
MRCKIEPRHLDQQPEYHPSIHLNINGIKTWPQSVQDRFNKFAVSKQIETLQIKAHHIILLSISDGPLPLLEARENHDQGQFTFVSFGILTYTYISIQHLIYAIPPAAYQKNICASNYNKSTAVEPSVQVLRYIFSDILLPILLYFRLILVHMAWTMNKRMVTSSNTAAERFA